MRRVLLCGVALLLAGCTSTGGVGPSGSATPPVPDPSSHTTSTHAPSSHTSSAPRSSATHPRSTPASSAAPASTAQQVLAGMSLRQRVGQLLMVDCSTAGVSAATSAAITQDDVGSVILDRTSYAGLAAAQAVTAQVRSLAPRDVGLFVATDQEGGEVQRLQGAGFTQIVSGVEQGTIPPAALQGYAQGWGEQLRSAGVNVNLAPVLDTVPAGFGSNPPIGDLDREFGNTPDVVTAHGVAVLRGMAGAGVDATVKHFPGLGRVRGNTDTSSGVTDDVTTRHDPYLAPFQAAVNAGVPFVMMSTAIYSRLDPGVPAAFSRTIVTGMLRGDLGFQGVIISDDLGAAKQVSGYGVGQRAIDFVAAGGDIVLTVDATEAATMTGALIAKAQSDKAFAQLVNAAALRVLQAKQARGLLH